MPPKNKSPDSESRVSCVYCGEHVSSTSTPPVQKLSKTKVQSQNRALSDRIRRRKFMMKKLANRATLDPIKRSRTHKRKHKKRMQRPIDASAEGDAAMKTTPKLGEVPEEREITPLYKGIILGLMLGTGLNPELVSGKIPPVHCDKFLELVLKTPSVLFRNMQSPPDENPARQSDHVLSAENLSQEPQLGPSAVIGNPSPGWPNQAECPDETLETSICTQTDSWSQLPNLGDISSRITNQIEEPAPSVMDSKPSQVPIQEDDPVLKPDDDPVQKMEVCLNEN